MNFRHVNAEACRTKKGADKTNSEASPMAVWHMVLMASSILHAASWMMRQSQSGGGGGDPSVLHANYPPQLTVGRRPLGGGGGGDLRGGSGRANGGGV